MQEDLEAERQLWLSGRGGRKNKAVQGKSSHRRGVPLPLSEAARRTWRTAVGYAARYLGDSALAAEIVEGVVHSSAKAHRNKPIKNPDSYLLSGVIRQVKKLLAREQRVEYVGSFEELENFPAAQDTTWVARLENQLLVEELVGFMEKEPRDIFLKWSRGDDWEEIAGDLRVSVNAAQHRLRYGIEKARERVFRSKSARPTPVPTD